jgi:hypothetical protein
VTRRNDEEILNLPSIWTLARVKSAVTLLNVAAVTKDVRRRRDDQ